MLLNLKIFKICIMHEFKPDADQSSKAAFCKSAFAKSKLTFGKSAFVRSRFAFRQSIFASQEAMVWPSATSKMLSPKTCPNVLERIFAFCQIGVRHVVSLAKQSTFQQKRFCQKQLCQIGLRPALLPKKPKYANMHENSMTIWNC